MSDERGFEEQAAERELEQVRRDLEESRRRARQASEEFDRFIRSFTARERSAAPVETLPPAAPPAVEPRETIVAPDPVPTEPLVRTTPLEPTTPLDLSEHMEPPDAAAPPDPLAALDTLTLPDPVRALDALTLPDPVVPPDAVTLPDTPTAAPTQPPAAPAVAAPASQPQVPQPPRVERVIPAALALTVPKPGKRLRYVVFATIIVGVALIVRWLMTPVEAPAAPEPVPVATAAPPAPAKPEPIPAAELVTTRAVWVRVLVDGERTIERELPANTRIPLAATGQIVIRAGDAGAVRVVLEGKDQGPLGKDGFPVTRNFNISR